MYKIKQKPEDFFVKEISTAKIVENGEYSYFLLKKKNYTTIRALQHIANFLRIPLKNLGFAGTKDKNALTEQVVSAKNVGKDRISKIKLKDIEIEYLGKGETPISLGDLEGNFFRIVVRDAEKEPKKLKRFRNLFGEQRFSKNNAEVGKAIVKKEFEKAVGLVLENKGDNENALNEYLSKKPKDFVGALRRIPLKILKMYVHAYQSLLWNRMTEGSDADELELIGFGTNADKEIMGVLKKEGVKTRDFIIRQLPELSSEGDSRKVFAEAKDLKIKKIDEKTFEFEFVLPKGSYATVFIAQSF